MDHVNHVWIIDDVPSEPSMISYFQALDLKIIQTPSIKPLCQMIQPLAAVLISSQFIEDNLILLDMLYRQYRVPIIVMSNTANEELCIRALQAGADDFLVKPIHPRELVARISTITRRVQQDISNTDTSKEMLLFEGWRLNPASRQLFDQQNQEHVLSHKAFDLLLAFLHHPHQILDRYYLSVIAQYQQRDSTDRRIDLQISRLRHQLERQQRATPLIMTIRNKGYIFTADVESVKQ